MTEINADYIREHYGEDSVMLGFAAVLEQGAIFWQLLAQLNEANIDPSEWHLSKWNVVHRAEAGDVMRIEMEMQAIMKYIPGKKR